MNNKKLKRLIIAALAFVIIICLVVVGWFMVLPSIQYHKAIELYDSGEFLQAAEIFDKLQDYKESAIYSERSKNKYSYNAAINLFENQEFEQALPLFESIVDFKDSEDYLEKCETELKYIEGMQLFNKKEYENAETLFAEIGDFKDSVELVEKCKSEQNYIEAISLMESGNNKDAKLIFESMLNYKDSAIMALVCGYKISYIEAKEKAEAEEFTDAWKLLILIELGIIEKEIDLNSVVDPEEFYTLKNECYQYYCYERGNIYYEEEKYYYAYLWFNETEIFDSKEKAGECIQPFVNGEIYSNPDYSKNEVTITFRSEKNYSKNECIKMISSSGDLVSVVAIMPGHTVRISIPEGAYYIKGGAGLTWFGVKDFFGDDGYYYKVKFDEDDCFLGDREKKIFWSMFTHTIDIGDEGNGNLASIEISYKTFCE